MTKPFSTRRVLAALLIAAYAFQLFFPSPVAAAPPHLVPFMQYNATIYTYSGIAPIADWGTLPTVAPITSAVRVAVGGVDYFVAHAATDGSLWIATAALLGTDFRRLQRHRTSGPATPASFPGCRLAALPRGPNSRDSVVFACSSGSLLTCAVHPTSVSAPFLACVRTAWLSFPSGATVNAVAVQWAYSATAPHATTPVGHAIVVGTTRGLFIFNRTTGVTTAVGLVNTNGTRAANASNVTAVTCLPRGVVPSSGRHTEDGFQGGSCYAATNENYCSPNICPLSADLVHRVDNTGHETYYYRVPGIIDRIPQAMVYDATRNGIHFAGSTCDDLLFANNSFQRIEGMHGGLPQNGLTAGTTTTVVINGTASGNNVWFGSTQGAMMLRPDGTWKYFFGPRWLPGVGFTTGMNVAAVAGASIATGDAVREVTLVATDQGVSFIAGFQWTLEEKAAWYQSTVYPRHDRFGLCEDVGLASFGNVSSWHPGPTANSGLWTSLYLAAQSFRYATTFDPAARAHAWGAFEGMFLLINATGIPGYPARSVVNSSRAGQGDWFASPTMPGWWFLGDTSSDEITGHLSAYPIFHDLVAETPAERAKVLGVIDAIAGGIVRNNFTLVGETGKATSWGKWGPIDINDSPFFYDGRGVQSMQVISYLSNAYRLTGKSEYADACRTLVNDHNYDENIVSLKITQPSDVNYSDDELSFLPYLAFLWSGLPLRNGTVVNNPCYDLVRDQVFASITRTYHYVKREKPNLWGYIYALWVQQEQQQQQQQQRRRGETPAASEDAAATAVSDALWTMQTWPLSFINYPVQNMERLDIIANPHSDRSGNFNTLMETLLPYDELNMQRWNSNPFHGNGGNGYDECDPSAWLYPYWLARWAAFL